jgi:hypothetical protein
VWRAALDPEKLNPRVSTFFNYALTLCGLPTRHSDALRFSSLETCFCTEFRSNAYMEYGGGPNFRR